MARQLFSLLTLLSALLAAAIAYGWVTTGNSTAWVYLQREDWDLSKSINRAASGIVMSSGQLSCISVGDPASEWREQVDRTIGFLQINQPLKPKDFGDKNPTTHTTPAWVAFLIALALPTARGLLLLRDLRRSAAPVRRRRERWSLSLLRVSRALFILLFAAAVAFCVRSYPYFERIDLRLLPGPAAVQVNSSRGSVMFAWTEAGPARTLANGGLVFLRSTIPDQRGPLRDAAGFKVPYHHAAGFSIGTDGTTPLMWNVIVLPYWFVFVVTALLAYASIRAFRRARDADRLAAAGLCPICNYDLRGGGERCPECGTTITPEGRVGFIPTSAL